MAGTHTGQVELTDSEREVLAVLRTLRQPADVVAVASASRLQVSEATEILRSLLDKGVIEEREPEPIRKRFEVDTDVFEKVAG
jgi:predicted transcriptional regulator